MDGNIYVGLVHYPVLNQNGQEVTTSITNLDIHDIARLSKTYSLSGYYIIQPLPKQHKMIDELLDYWKRGGGSTYNIQRKEALSFVEVVNKTEDAIKKIRLAENGYPNIIITSAIKRDSSVSFLRMREIISDGGVYLILLGTGWGFSDDFINEAEYVLDPIEGLSDYNHLSVRSAASIIIDRLCCKKWW